MGRQYVGIDFHRRRSVVVRMSATGEKLSTVRIADDPVALAAAVAAAGPEPEVVIEATYGWYWVVDLLQANGARVHLANPQGLNWGQRRVKNDELDAIAMAHSYTTRVASLRDLIEVYDGEVGMLEGQIHRQLRHHRGYRAIHAINGVGPTIAAILVADIGDVARFRSAEALCSWAGLTPKHRESDTIVRRGRITKQGSKLVRWAVIEAVSRYHGGPKLAGDFRRIAERRGTNKARVAVARKVLTLVYYGLRDGEIRCLARAEAA